MLKYLRIAVTALSLTACVPVIALWVRSYTWIDVYAIDIEEKTFAIQSAVGRLWFMRIFYVNSFHQRVKDRESVEQYIRRDENGTWL